MKIPTLLQAQNIIKEAASLNPGLWVSHSRVAGKCAAFIAEKCTDMDSDTACVLGLLHDIGRRFGVTDMRHVIDGYHYMLEQEFDDCARICLTHSFPYKDIKAFSGYNDCTDEESDFLQNYIKTTEYDDYDKLIQLCDALALPSGPTFIEKRLVDVAIRRGFNDFTIPKWKEFLKLKKYFDNKTGCDIYKIIGVGV